MIIPIFTLIFNLSLFLIKVLILYSIFDTIHLGMLNGASLLTNFFFFFFIEIIFSFTYDESARTQADELAWLVNQLV